MSDNKNRWAAPIVAVSVALLAAVFHTVAFPFAFVDGRILSVPEAAFVFLAPLVVWLSKKRGLRVTLVVGGCAFFASWLVLLSWLRHVTYFGTFGLALVMAVFPTLWLLAARQILPGMARCAAPARLLCAAGLAGLWVVFEWVRTWILSGFPWLPLAASQYDRPALLQILPITGWGGLSWLLAYFNVALGSYALAIFRPRLDMPWWRRLNPELYSALFLVGASVLSVLPLVHGRGEGEKLFDAGLVQPYSPGLLKWDPALANDNLLHLERLSLFAAGQQADVVFWPESSTPWPIVGPDPTMSIWAGDLARTLGVPLVMGNMAALPDSGCTKYYNGIFIVNPEGVLERQYYAKQKLVPFGEYNPLGWLTDNFIDIPYASFRKGDGSIPTLLLTLPGGRTLRMGTLVCYEDIFPSLARKSTLAGAEFIFVATNNAWYGEEAGAYQHAAHSILRAVENRRPVLRCGNGGWSGLIDEFGSVRHLSERPGEGVYFEGEDVVTVHRTPSCAGMQTFYTRHGDWIVLACALAAILAWFVSRGEGEPEEAESQTPPPPPEPGISEERRKARELLRRGKFGIGRRFS
jgi:apolipoprotein N-acyltransferase